MEPSSNHKHYIIHSIVLLIKYIFCTVKNFGDFRTHCTRKCNVKSQSRHCKVKLQKIYLRIAIMYCNFLIDFSLNIV